MDNRRAQVAHKAAENRKANELYIMRQLSNKGPEKTTANTNKNGELLTSKKERQARW